jgi:hypothetical protein
LAVALTVAVSASASASASASTSASVPTFASISASAARISASGPAISAVGRAVPARDLGPCWAQAGRVVGGFFGSIGATIASPWWGAAAWSGYLGQMAQEKRTASGDFAC